MKNYNIGDIFGFDDEYSMRAEFCNENGLIIKDTTKEGDVEQSFQIQEPHLTEKELAAKEMWQLKNWFETTYTYQEQKYRRLVSLNKFDDDGGSAAIKLNMLYEEAESKRIRIQELESKVETSM